MNLKKKLKFLGEGWEIYRGRGFGGVRGWTENQNTSVVGEELFFPNTFIFTGNWYWESLNVNFKRKRWQHFLTIYVVSCLSKTQIPENVSESRVATVSNASSLNGHFGNIALKCI